MATVNLDVATTRDAGVRGAFIALDAEVVRLTDGKGSESVDASDDTVTYTYWFLGNAGSQFSFEISQGGHVLKRVQDSIATGFNRAAGSGFFKLATPGT